MIFDTHTHYDDKTFDGDRHQILSQLKKQGVEAVVNIGADVETSKSTVDLIHQYDHVYGVVGIHPSSADQLNQNVLDWLKEASNLEKVVAIGEIGLDYYWGEPDKQIQKEAFVKQLHLAQEVRLPVVIHSRDAAADTLDLIKTQWNPRLGGVIHCFSYGVDMARQYIDLGFYLGIGGVLTFQNAKKLKEVVEVISIDHLVLETDCPYLSPVPNRGKRNDSTNLTYVVDAIATIKGIKQEEVIARTNENARRMYGINQ